MDYKKKDELKNKVKGGDMGSLPEYLSMLRTDSLDRLKVCSPADLKYYQSRHATLDEILNLLN